MLVAAREAGAERFFYSSSACVYNGEKQSRADVTALKEDDAYPAMPEDGYGWEKLFSERMARHYREDYGLATRVARYHNVYGPEGTYDGGREKAPAAICRKVVAAKLSGNHEIEIWGDGEQTRSFMYIDDCIDGTIRLAESDIIEPLNIGSDELVTINRLVDIVEEIAGITLKRSYKLDAPKGVRGRNSDNTLIKKLLNWAPSIRLEDGLEKTYKWIYDQMSSGKASVANTGPPTPSRRSREECRAPQRPVRPDRVPTACVWASGHRAHCDLGGPAERLSSSPRCRNARAELPGCCADTGFVRSSGCRSGCSRRPNAGVGGRSRLGCL